MHPMDCRRSSCGDARRRLTRPARAGPVHPVIAPVAPIDYTILRNQAFTYTDLTQAKASGLSDNQVATVAKIAEETVSPSAPSGRIS